MKTLISLGITPAEAVQVIEQLTFVAWCGIAAVVGIIALAVFNFVKRI